LVSIVVQLNHCYQNYSSWRTSSIHLQAQS
jgi:hypothetical protein